MDRPVSDYRTRDVPVDGGALRVGVWGNDDAPTIIAIHGITASHLAWLTVAAAAAASDIRIIAPDLRGRGASAGLPGPWGMARHADDIAAVLDAFDLATAPLVGHSMGAFVALATAGQHPSRVSGLLLVDGGLTLDLPAGVTLGDAAALLGPAAARLAMTFADRPAYREFWRAHPAFIGEWSPAIETYVDYDLVGTEPMLRSRTSADAMRADAVELYGGSVAEEALLTLTAPTTLLTAPRGLQNEVPGLYAPTALERWTARVPALTIVQVDDTNHYTILMGDRGASIVAEHARALLAR